MTILKNNLPCCLIKVTYLFLVICYSAICLAAGQEDDPIGKHLATEVISRTAQSGTKTIEYSIRLPNPNETSRYTTEVLPAPSGETSLEVLIDTRNTYIVAFRPSGSQQWILGYNTRKESKEEQTHLVQVISSQQNDASYDPHHRFYIPYYDTRNLPRILNPRIIARSIEYLNQINPDSTIEPNDINSAIHSIILYYIAPWRFPDIQNYMYENNNIIPTNTVLDYERELYIGENDQPDTIVNIPDNFNMIPNLQNNRGTIIEETDSNSTNTMAPSTSTNNTDTTTAGPSSMQNHVENINPTPAPPLQNTPILSQRAIDTILYFFGGLTKWTASRITHHPKYKR